MIRNEIIEKIKKMNKEQLFEYRVAAKGAGNLIDFLGVMIILMVLIFTSILTILPASIFLYVMANIATGISETINLIDQRVEQLEGNK